MTYPQQSKTVHSETLNDELCIYDWQRKEVHALNPTVAQVWQMCDGQTAPAQMADLLRADILTDLDAAQAQAVVAASLAQLQNAHLLEGEAPNIGKTKPVSRRDMLAWGLSALLVPAIRSILAPSPVEAQSPVPTNTPAPPVPPTAVDDGGNSIPANSGTPLSLNVTDNDSLGMPAATVISFGGGTLGGTVLDHAAGASVGLAGGTLMVQADGQATLTAPTLSGTYTFQYRLSNSVGNSDATVTIDVTAPPLPVQEWVLLGSAVRDGDWINLTGAVTNQSGAALYPTAFSFGANFTVSFDYANFGGTGADGLCVFFYDGNDAYYPPTLGYFGGCLGYASYATASQPGLSHAYLGIGLDELGNFSQPWAGSGGPGLRPDSVVLRGSGNGTTGYNYLVGVSVSPRTIDGVTRDSPRHVVVNLNNGLVTVMVDFGSGNETLISGYNLTTAPGQIAAPATLRVGIAAATGAATNNHQVTNFAVS